MTASNTPNYATQLFLDFAHNKPGLLKNTFYLVRDDVFGPPTRELADPEVFAEVDFEYILTTFPIAEVFRRMEQGRHFGVFGRDHFTYTPKQFEAIFVFQGAYQYRHLDPGQLEQADIPAALNRIPVQHKVFGNADLNPFDYKLKTDESFHNPHKVRHRIPFFKDSSIPDIVHSLDILLSELQHSAVKRLFAEKFRIQTDPKHFSDSDYRALHDLLIKHGINAMPHEVFSFSNKSFTRKASTEDDILSGVGAIIANGTMETESLDLRARDLTRLNWPNTLEAVAKQYGTAGLEVIGAANFSASKINFEDHSLLNSFRNAREERITDVLHPFRAGAGVWHATTGIFERQGFVDRLKETAARVTESAIRS